MRVSTFVICLGLLLVGVAPGQDSLNCRSVGSWPFGPYCYAAAVDSVRSLAFCGSSGGVFVLDVSDPSQPTIVSASIGTTGSVTGLAYQTNRLHIATSTSFEVWDVTIPSNPALLSRLNTRNYAASVTVAGAHAFVAVDDADSGKYSGLSVIDISDPAHPSEVGYLELPRGGDVDVAVAGDYVFFADGDDGGLHIIDITNPQNPQEVGCCDSLGDAEGVTVAGHNAFVADCDSGLRVVDVSDPHNPRQVGQCAARGACDVVLAGSHAYVANCREDRLDVFDISNPLSPYEVGYSGFLDGPTCVVVAGNLAYVGVEWAGLALVDVSSPTSPHEVGDHKNPGVTYKVAVSDGRAYLADADEFEGDSVFGVLRVVDVSDPHAPAQVGQCDLSNFAIDVVVAGNLAYVAAYDGLHVVDVADPQDPQEVGYCPAAAMAFGVDVVGNYAYVGYGCPDNCTGMCVVDIANPHNPQVVGTCGAPGIWWATVAVSGNHAFLADQEGGLRIIDISDPQNPHEVAYSPLAATAVALRGNYAYVLADSQLYVLDISDPLNPQQVGSCLSAASDVAVDGDYAYLSDGASGGCALRVIRISDPQSLQEVGYYRMLGDASGVAVGGGYVYVARYYDGLQVFEFYGTGVQETMNDERATMNVPPSIVRGVLFLPASGAERRASSVLLDASGRKVAELHAGANDVSRLNPGVYFVRQASSVVRDVSGVTKVIVTR